MKDLAEKQRTEELPTWVARHLGMTFDDNAVTPAPSPDAHYKQLKIEPLEIAKANFTKEQYQAYLQITAHKYLMRFPYKGTPIADLKKCKVFIDLLIKDMENDCPI